MYLAEIYIEMLLFKVVYNHGMDINCFGGYAYLTNLL